MPVAPRLFLLSSDPARFRLNRGVRSGPGTHALRITDGGRDDGLGRCRCRAVKRFGIAALDRCAARDGRSGAVTASTARAQKHAAAKRRKQEDTPCGCVHGTFSNSMWCQSCDGFRRPYAAGSLSANQAGN